MWLDWAVVSFCIGAFAHRGQTAIISASFQARFFPQVPGSPDQAVPNRLDTSIIPETGKKNQADAFN